MKKFTENEIFINTLKTYPKVRIFTYSGSLYYNGTVKSGPQLNDFLMEPPTPPAAPIFIESFDFSDGWSGTISNSLYYLTFTFSSSWVEDFDTGW